MVKTKTRSKLNKEHCQAIHYALGKIGIKQIYLVIVNATNSFGKYLILLFHLGFKPLA